MAEPPWKNQPPETCHCVARVGSAHPAGQTPCIWAEPIADRWGEPEIRAAFDAVTFITYDDGGYPIPRTDPDDLIEHLKRSAP